MRSIESEGSTIDDAIETALATLHVARDQVEIDILHDATRGVLGFGGRKARVRATVRERVSLATPGPSPTVVSQETAPAPTPVPIELADQVRRILDAVLSYLGATCSVAPAEGSEPGVLTLAVDGEGSGLVIGRRGQTLDALEYLLNRIAGRHPGGEGIRVRIDVEHYRERRQESLEQLARRLAEKAKESGNIVTLNPLSPRDRRIVHLALDGDPAVTTRSEGDGHFRRVLIVPQGRGQRATGRR
jgi:spoIIIJ-associated protein